MFALSGVFSLNCGPGSRQRQRPFSLKSERYLWRCYHVAQTRMRKGLRTPLFLVLSRDAKRVVREQGYT